MRKTSKEGISNISENLSSIIFLFWSLSISGKGFSSFLLILFHNLSNPLNWSFLNEFKSRTFNPRRVNISAVGFEIDRVVLPAIELKADKVWLITHNNKSEDKGFEFVNKIKDRLKEVKIEVEEEEADRKDLFDTLRAFRSIVAKEEGNEIINSFYSSL